MKSSLVVFLHSHHYDRLYQAVSLMLTASSMGRTCHLFLFYHALASFVGDRWDDVNIEELSSTNGKTPEWVPALQKNFELANMPSLYEMLEKCKEESGGLRVYACSASTKMLDLDLDSVRERVDEIVGLPTMMQIANSADQMIYI